MKTTNKFKVRWQEKHWIHAVVDAASPEEALAKAQDKDFEEDYETDVIEAYGPVVPGSYICDGEVEYENYSTTSRKTEPHTDGESVKGNNCGCYLTTCIEPNHICTCGKRQLVNEPVAVLAADKTHGSKNGGCYE